MECYQICIISLGKDKEFIILRTCSVIAKWLQNVTSPQLQKLRLTSPYHPDLNLFPSIALTTMESV